MNEMATPQEFPDVNEFNAYLTSWLGSSSEKTLGGASEAAQHVLTVVIGGVECRLGSETTRGGVQEYLAAFDTTDPVFVVVEDDHGAFTRVVLGHGGESIQGFELYTAEPQGSSTVLDDTRGWPLANGGDASSLSSSTSWTPPDLTHASASDLFRLQGQLLRELRNRDVVRTNNPPVGDYAEWLVAKALQSERLPANSTKSYDLEAKDYGLVQVKARLVSTPARSGQLQTSPFRSEDFHHAVLVLLSDVDFSVVSAVLLPLEALQSRWDWRPHVKGWTVRMTGPTMNHDEAKDISDDLRRAADSLA